MLSRATVAYLRADGHYRIRWNTEGGLPPRRRRRVGVKGLGHATPGQRRSRPTGKRLETALKAW